MAVLSCWEVLLPCVFPLRSVVRHSDKLYLDAVATKSGDSSIAVALKFRPREVCGGNNRRISVAKVGALVDEVCEARFVSVSL